MCADSNSRLAAQRELGGGLDVDAIHAGGRSAGRRWRRRGDSAPRLAAAAARANPILPLERLPRKRTGSIGSRVPPAVTRTLSPSQGRAPSGSLPQPRPAGAGDRGDGQCRVRPVRRAGPHPGSMTVTPRSRSVSRFSCVAGSLYIRSFIAGATNRGAVEARNAVVTIESQIPAASLAIVFAEAGAIR